MNVPPVVTTTVEQERRDAALRQIAARHMDAYWRGCVQGNFGRAEGFCETCDALAVLFGPEWSALGYDAKDNPSYDASTEEKP